MKFAVIVFPGSNCDSDAHFAINSIEGCEAEFVWHKTARFETKYDCLVLPGGFSYGDYLRSGAIARFSPVMREVVDFAKKGGKLVGICNGFQILIESGLLPGALLRNKSLNFVCKDVYLKTENNSTPFTSFLDGSRILRLPVAHGDGNYFADSETLKALEGEGRVVFRYCDVNGEAADSANPNGSLGNIAGICSENGNILGMMPHPERYSDEILGCADGKEIFSSLLKSN